MAGLSKKRLLAGFFSIFVAVQAVPQEPAERVGGEVIDRVLAVVEEDPILASDVDQLIGLGLVERAEGEEEQDFRRRVLDRLIEQRLRFHEVDRFGFAEIPIAEIDRQVQGVRERFAGEEQFRAQLEGLGLDEQGLRQILARQFMVLIYVEERLGARVFVGLDDIRTYYEETLVPDLRGRGLAVPPLAEVREQIRTLLKEIRLDEEIRRWTEELRQEADIENYFDELHEAPPALPVDGEQ